MFQVRTLVAALLLGLIGLTLEPTDSAGAGPIRPGGYTIAGTTVTKDGIEPVPGVRVTVMPESTSAISDQDGDFLVSWNGREGSVTFVPIERGRDGQEWCKRLALPAASDTIRDSVVDLGSIRITPRVLLGYARLPSLPRSHPRPGVLRVPGPNPGEKDTCRVRITYATDLRGRVTRVGIGEGDTPPPQLREAIFAWVRSVPWDVPRETACSAPEEFQGLDEMDYAWTDSVWVKVPALDPIRRAREAAGSPPKQ